MVSREMLNIISVLATTLIGLTVATDHTIGGPSGWTVGANLASWSTGKTFSVGDNLGFTSLEELYYRTWLHSEQRVIVEEKVEDLVVKNVVTIQGLTNFGYLLAIGDDNQMYELHPDGNSFDYFKGLVRRKL